MRSAYLSLAVALTGLVPVSLQAQTAPAEPAVTVPAAPTPDPVLQRTTTFKLGTGLTRGLELGGFYGVSLPVVLGIEHHLTPAWSVTGNVYGGLAVLHGRSYYRRPLLQELGFDAGIRRYYNQEKRRQKGRATGPFVGNYLSLMTTSTWGGYKNYDGDTNRFYDYSTLTLVWGMQRRLGRHGLLDAYVGAGVANDIRSRNRNGSYEYGRFLNFAPELGVRISLAR